MNGNCEKFYVAKVVKAPHSKEEKRKKCSAPANSFCIDKKENKPFLVLGFQAQLDILFLPFYILCSLYAMHGQVVSDCILNDLNSLLFHL